MKWNCISGLIFIAYLICPHTAYAQVGYYEGQRAFLPDSSRETYRGGSFQIRITRSAASSDDRSLIEHAERLYPMRDLIDVAAAAVQYPSITDRLQKAALIPGDRWWWDDSDWFLTPFALTGTAVQHYVERMRRMAADPVQIGPYAPPQGLVNYSARVLLSGAEASERQVELDLRVEVTCGQRCGLYFSHTRVVTFDKAGKVIRVVGDGRPRLVAS